MKKPSTSSKLPENEWRVHVAALGFEELNRVVRPLEDLGADAFYLLEHPKDDRARREYSSQWGVKVEDVLNELDLFDWAVWPANLWSPAAVANVLGEKMKEGRFSRLHVNVSTGPKTVGIGATLASLFCPVSLYYADLDYDKPAPKTAWGREVQRIQHVPTFRARTPRQDVVKALQLVAAKSGRVKAKVLKEAFVKEGIIAQSKRKSQAKAKFSPQAINSQFQSLVGPLKAQMLLDETELGSTKYYEISEQGQATLRMLSVFDWDDAE